MIRSYTVTVNWPEGGNPPLTSTKRLAYVRGVIESGMLEGIGGIASELNWESPEVIAIIEFPTPSPNGSQSE